MGGGKVMTLDKAARGEKRRVISVGGDGIIRTRLLELGFVPGTEVTVGRRSPFGDPVEVKLRGYRLTMRISDLRLIKVERTALK